LPVNISSVFRAINNAANLSNANAIYLTCVFSNWSFVLKQKSDEDHGLPSLSLVFGYIAVKEIKDDKEEQVKVLSRLGYGNAEISRIIDSPITSVRTMKSQKKVTPRRKKKAQKKKRKSD